MKVRILEKESKYDLEIELNRFLRDVDPANILDIKYSGAGTYAPYGIKYYSAMVIMK